MNQRVLAAADNGQPDDGDRVFTVGGHEYILHKGQTQIDIDGKTWTLGSDGKLMPPDDGDRVFTVGGHEYTLHKGQTQIDIDGKTWTLGPDGRLMPPDNGDRVFEVNGHEYTLAAGQNKIDIDGKTWELGGDGKLHPPDNGDRVFKIGDKEYTLHAGQNEIEIDGQTWKVDADGKLHTDDKVFKIGDQSYVVKPGQKTLTVGKNTYIIGEDGSMTGLPDGMDFHGFEVALGEMSQAVTTVKQLSRQVGERMTRIGTLFDNIGDGWQSPSALSAKNVTDWFKKSSKDLNDLLDDANERLRTSYQNYHDIEQQNLNNIS
ncbi:WXG100 family type VII secretion target [Pseudonocardia spinosispora]|uniref:WXG100 family type VII secretion target n=1 Tax=Pseudonocardia spinosispora TaxID=103441 RepID=UPI000401A443|nr:hypothetical protein [Pseudonocardia spinosispora]